jgi:hypothetical protein
MELVIRYHHRIRVEREETRHPYSTRVRKLLNYGVMHVMLQIRKVTFGVFSEKNFDIWPCCCC